MTSATGLETGFSARRAIDIGSGAAAVVLDGLVITGGRTIGSEDSGGGIRSEAGLTTIRNSRIVGNSTAGDAAVGGGIAGVDPSFFGARLRIENSAIVDNRTEAGGARGGGVAGFDMDIVGSTITGNRTQGIGAGGGGVESQGILTIDGSTISGNRTTGERSFGGGVFHLGSIATLTNSTIADNLTSGAEGDGGGLASFGDAVRLLNATFTGNATANGSGGAIAIRGGEGAAYRIENSLVVGNVAAASDTDAIAASFFLGGALDVRSSIISADPNAAEVVFAATRVLTVNGQSVRAGVLADNGGGIETVGLRAGSRNPALDAANAGAPATDQRGEDRFDALPGGSIADIGAFELQQPAALEPAEIIVDTALDVVDGGDGATSLREAVSLASLFSVSATIGFAPALAGATLSLGGQIVIAEDLIINGDVNGDRRADIIIDANADGDANAATLATGTEPGFEARRAFSVQNGAEARFESVTITGGFAIFHRGAWRSMITSTPSGAATAEAETRSSGTLVKSPAPTLFGVGLFLTQFNLRTVWKRGTPRLQTNACRERAWWEWSAHAVKFALASERHQGVRRVCFVPYVSLSGRSALGQFRPMSFN